MKYLLLILISTNTYALTKADFFPKYRNGVIISVRVFEKDKLERSMEQLKDTYRIVTNHIKFSRVPSDVSYPIHQLSQYSFCRLSGTLPLQVNNHFEPTHFETNFKCVTPPDFDPVAFRKKIQANYCSDSKIRSDTQERICKELLLR